MSKYQVARVFPSNPPLRHGQIIDNPAWRNLNLLVRNGYLREITEETVEEIKIEKVLETGSLPPVTPAKSQEKKKNASKK